MQYERKDRIRHQLPNSTMPQHQLRSCGDHARNKGEAKAVTNLPTLVFHKLLKKVLGKGHGDMLAYDIGSGREPFVSLNKGGPLRTGLSQASLRKHAG
jgi:hypothetical protein